MPFSPFADRPCRARLTPAPPTPAAGSPAQTRALCARPVVREDTRRLVSSLLQRRYAWRGYGVAELPDAREPLRRTLAVASQGQLLGTLTVGLDGARPLNCEALFGPEVAALRRAGARLCEVSRLAVEAGPTHSAQVLTALFLGAFELAHGAEGKDTLLVEVHPRHVGYYRRRFGAVPLAAPRHHPGVNAPAALLRLALRDLAALAHEAACAAAATPVRERAPLSAPAAAARARSAPEWRS